MVALTALWLPIVVSAVLVFLASSVLRMVLTHHRTDYGKLPEEERLLEAMRGAKLTPGAYAFPHAASGKEMGSPEMLEKLERGPVGLMMVRPSGPPAMGNHLALWFGYCLLVSLFAGYLAGVTLAPGTEYLRVFRIAGTVALLGYAAGDLVDSIWKGQPWSVTAKGIFDGIVYALLTAGVFGWLWPSA